MRFYAIKLPKFLSGVVKAIARLFTKQRTIGK
ncbi:MAG: stage V sporulation protein M [Bacillaceae bacterium G1]|nr:stage V sporulation protein SpoVM [Bacillota bacterium]OJF17437.1 MAG: stage V sporulation protein M [Bacillaceae bacterium G1]